MAVVDNSITRFRGDTYPLIVTLKENSLAVDLTTAVIKMSIKYSTSITITGTVTDASNGIVQFDFEPGDVDSVGRFAYDIQVEDGGYITTYVKDIFELIEDIIIT